MLLRIVLAVLIALPLVPTPAPAQGPATGQETQLQIEVRRKRLVVTPPPPVETAVGDAERAADEATAAAVVRQANDPVRQRPQLDYDVTSAIQARGAQRAIRR